jgi:osmotically-inducible protein OsmY
MASDRSNGVFTLLAGLGIGAALMYFLDRDRGRRRRAFVRDQAARASRVTGRELAQRAHGAKNRAQGAVAELRGRFGDATVDDDQLVARVRAELGRQVDRTGAIEVVAEHGAVTLRGQVSVTGVDEIVAAVRGVPGVTRVHNDLDIERPSDTASTLL